MEKHIEMKMCNYKHCVSRGLFLWVFPTTAFLIGIPMGIFTQFWYHFAITETNYLHNYTLSELSKLFYWEWRSSENILIGILIRIEDGSGLSNVCRMGIKFFAGEVRVGTRAPI